jgi:leader peptidase (prepilin peptidase) / N-methyltransferase
VVQHEPNPLQVRGIVEPALSSSAWMILSPPLLARWSTSVLRIASAMRAVHFVLAGAALSAGVAASVVLVPDSRGSWGAGLAVLMVAIAVVDARRFIIPDELTGAALGLGLVYAVVEGADPWAQALVWAVLRGAVPALAFLGVRAAYRRWRGLEGIGLGDVKLAAVAGVWLDWPTIPVAVEIAALTALGTYMVMHFYFRRTVRPTTRLPFGLFLAPAIWIAWILDATLLL